MTVVNISVRDKLGQHLPFVNFIPGDGGPATVEHSPFTYDYNPIGSPYTAVIDKAGFTHQRPVIAHDAGAVAYILSPIYISPYPVGYFLDNPTFSNGILISARIRTYSVAGSIGTVNDVIETYTVGAAEIGGLLASFWVTRS